MFKGDLQRNLSWESTVVLKRVKDSKFCNVYSMLWKLCQSGLCTYFYSEDGNEKGHGYS